MSNQDLGKVLSRLPEYFQERAVISSLNIMLSTGELDMANRLVEDISRSEARDTFKAEAISIGVAVAVRSRNPQLAGKRYDSIHSMNMTEKIINHLADALFNLSDLLLSDKPSRLAALWHDAISARLPFHAQTIFAQLGLMLCRQFYRNNDREAANLIARAMQIHLDPDFCGGSLEKLAGLKSKNNSR